MVPAQAPVLTVVDVELTACAGGDGGQIAIIPPVINVAYRSGGGGAVAGPAVYRTAITREATRGRRANLVTTSLSVSY